jgi:soluble lytic murein transglycosylase-like protein
VAKTYNLSHALLHAIITVESWYDPNAVSTAGAVGLMQLMPETGKRYGVINRRNVKQNINGGSRYFSDLLNMFNNDIKLALAAYNAGENAVKKYQNKVPPYKETKNYIKKVMKYYKRYQRTMT